MTTRHKAIAKKDKSKGKAKGTKMASLLDAAAAELQGVPSKTTAITTAATDTLEATESLEAIEAMFGTEYRMNRTLFFL